MTIAVSSEPLQDIQEAVLSVLLFSLIPTTQIVVDGGILLARHTVSRLDRIDASLKGSRLEISPPASRRR